ncbi:MAG: hypothetical protein SH808_04585 [Saprospiraceae bacterium]|nr:hypothetical protein [Saprospiraceae bacterium]
MKNAVSHKEVTAPAKILSLDTFKFFQKITHHHPYFGGSPYPQGRLAIPGMEG